jgi:D-arabinose 1-dehydrogenase-like Zn-dependent alcohol dehydrogenase
VRAHHHEARLEDVNRIFSDLRSGHVDGRVVLRLAEAA